MSAATSIPAPLSGVQSTVLRRVVARVVDDGVVLALAVGLAVAVATVVEANDSGVLQLDGVYWGDGYAYPGDAVPTFAVLLTIGLLLTAVLAYYLGASAAGGRTPGRALAGLQVVRVDGAPASLPQLLGRELLRVALVAFGLAIVWPLGAVTTAAAQQLSTDSEAVDLLTDAMQWVPFLIVAALWIGATLVDRLERAPHDWIARTLVVRAASATRAEAAANPDEHADS